jgi:hypothetical protein
MPDARAKPAVPRRNPLQVAREILLGTVTRLWALALIALVVFLSWRAFRYLLFALIFPSPTPPQIVQIPRRAAEELRAPAGPGFAGLTAVENPRAPVGHYHRIEPWFQPDPHNSCTQSGCHATLPHGRNKADRAFLNMHATSLHCGVCHLQVEQTPLPLTWYDLASGNRTDTPALLRAWARLLALPQEPGTTYTPADQAELVTLLRQAAQEAGGEPTLQTLAAHLAAVRAESTEFADLLAEARVVVPRHFRGEYGAKLALLDPGTKQPRLGAAGNQDAIRDYLQRKDTLSAAERAGLLARIHPTRRPQTLRCTECHAPAGSLVDLAAVGYPPARIQQLVQPLLMGAIQHIVEGQEFHMPTFIAPGDTPPQSQPGQP